MKCHIIIFRCQGIFKDCPKEIVIKIYMGPFLSGILKLEPCPDWSPFMISFKFSDEHPWDFHMGCPPRWVPALTPTPRRKQHHELTFAKPHRVITSSFLDTLIFVHLLLKLLIGFLKFLKFSYISITLLFECATYKSTEILYSLFN